MSSRLSEILPNEDRLTANYNSLNAQLAKNIIFLDKERLSWSVRTLSQPNEEPQTILIKNPTASSMSHRLLNPYIYRFVQPIRTLDDLATILQTPADWNDRFDRLVANFPCVTRLMMNIRNLPDETPESDIHSNFTVLVFNMAAGLDVDIMGKSETKIVVGGILARHEYDLRSKSDPHFVIGGVTLLASEIKTARCFPESAVWYQGCRGIQLISTLYYYNSPTLLLNQKHWKLFAENDERTAILTFPYNDDPQNTPFVNSILMEGIGTDFLKAITICLLSRRNLNVRNEPPLSNAQHSQKLTPEAVPQRRSLRIREKQAKALQSAVKQPSYFAGYRRGKRIYKTVRILPQHLVNEIADEIAREEMEEYQKKTAIR